MNPRHPIEPIKRAFFVGLRLHSMCTKALCHLADSSLVLMPYCKECGKVIEQGEKFCQSCGAEVFINRPRSAGGMKPRPPRLWYLVPLFFGIIGGIVGYVAVKGEDKKMAKRLLIFGIAFTLILYVGLAAIVATLVTGLGGRGAPPNAMLSVTARKVDSTHYMLTISHEGGDDMNVADLQVQASSSSSGVLQTLPFLNPSGGTTGTFSVSMKTTITCSYSSDVTGQVVTVYIIHKPSKENLFSSSSVIVQ